MNIEVSDEVGLQLEELAKERNLTVEELIGAMLDNFDVERRKNGTLADPAKMAKSMNLSTEEAVNTAERSREILQTEYPEYLSELLEKEYPPGSLARFAQVAIEACVASNEKVDTSARSREILNNEFADFIDRRIRR